MKLSTIVKIAITSSVLLLCTGFALYSYFKLSAADVRKDFNLYTLVPSNATAVFVTGDAAELVAEIEELTCSKNQQYLHVSKLFSSLKDYLYSLQEDAPHGLSRQMNRLLISFHQPDNDHNQVLYCRLGDGDRKLVDKFVQKHLSAAYPFKIFKYKGEDIYIYPMSDGDFLACYLTPDFLALSYQKKLIEEVIDTRKTGNSIASDSTFIEVNGPRKTTSTATIYARMDGMIGWTEFDMKLKDDFIYFSGISHDVDSCFTFINVLRQQEAVKGFAGDALPSTTFYLSRQGVTDWASLLAYGERQEYAVATRTREILDRDKELSRYLIENTGQDLVAFLFQREDSLLGPAAVMALSITDVLEAERMLRSFVEAAPLEEGERRNSRISFYYSPDKAYPVYKLPLTTLFSQLTGFSESPIHIYATFYSGRLLLAPDEDSLFRYIRQLDKGEVLDGALVYRAGTGSLSDSYHFMLMADFGQLLDQSGNHYRFIPDFFSRNSDFFRNFVIFVQFTCADGVIYPNIVLKYKTE